MCVNTPIKCDDNNECTADRCDPTSGCVFEAIELGECDYCEAGKLHKKSCDDKNACTKDSCNKNDAGEAKCKHEDVDCADNDPCTVDSCDPATGRITHKRKSCDDGSECTRDTCDGETGQCVNTPLPLVKQGNKCLVRECAEGRLSTWRQKACDDGDACTKDSCDAATGECRHEAVDCTDEDACTVNTCDRKLGCQKEAVVCDDNDACTVDRCDADLGCVFEPVTTENSEQFRKLARSCSPCMVPKCVGGEFIAEHEHTKCDDDNKCTVDKCTAKGCTNEPVNCDDGNPCTEDSCDAATGECINKQRDCGDGNHCTRDRCDVETGECVHEPFARLRNKCQEFDTKQEGCPAVGPTKDKRGPSSDCHRRKCVPTLGSD